MLFIPEKLKQTLKPLKPWVLHPIGEYKLMRQYQKASRKIFIDCGANTGKVLENAMKKRKGFEFYAFEPQPELVELGNRIKTGYPFVPFHFYPKAVWTDDGKLNFFLATTWADNFKGGSTLLAGHTQNQCNIDYQHPVSVESIDFSKWLSNTFRPDDYLVIKMDIEGAEYDVLEKMIDKGTIDFVNELIVEFHNEMDELITKNRHLQLVKRLKKKVKLMLWY